MRPRPCLQLDPVEFERRSGRPVLAQQLAHIGEILRQLLIASIAHIAALYVARRRFPTLEAAYLRTDRVDLPVRPLADERDRPRRAVLARDLRGRVVPRHVDAVGRDALADARAQRPLTQGGALRGIAAAALLPEVLREERADLLRARRAAVAQDRDE